LELFDFVVDLIARQIAQALPVVAGNIAAELLDPIFLHHGGHNLADRGPNSTLIRLSCFGHSLRQRSRG